MSTMDSVRRWWKMMWRCVSKSRRVECNGLSWPTWIYLDAHALNIVSEVDKPLIVSEVCPGFPVLHFTSPNLPPKSSSLSSHRHALQALKKALQATARAERFEAMLGRSSTWRDDVRSKNGCFFFIILIYFNIELYTKSKDGKTYFDLFWLLYSFSCFRFHMDYMCHNVSSGFIFMTDHPVWTDLNNLKSMIEQKASYPIRGWYAHMLSCLYVRVLLAPIFRVAGHVCAPSPCEGWCSRLSTWDFPRDCSCVSRAWTNYESDESWRPLKFALHLLFIQNRFILGFYT